MRSNNYFCHCLQHFKHAYHYPKALIEVSLVKAFCLLSNFFNKDFTIFIANIIPDITEIFVKLQADSTTYCSPQYLRKQQYINMS